VHFSEEINDRAMQAIESLTLAKKTAQNSAIRYFIWCLAKYCISVKGNSFEELVKNFYRIKTTIPPPGKTLNKKRKRELLKAA
jgi:hypothetical protein